MTSTTVRVGRVVALCLFILLGLAATAADVSETMLPNGLKVLIKESHAAPVVVVDVWYKVGSRNEGPGLTGASHLLEHMTYKGTKQFDKDAMRNLTKRNGAIDNGETFYDYTHYYTTIASDRLDLVLRMEASRMSSALIKQYDLDTERTVVRSELEGRENNPFSLLFQETMAAAFRVSPYHWPVIGWRADIEHVTANDLRAYYQNYYLPNNATLVIVGDVNTRDAQQLVEKYFGKLRAGIDPPQWTTPEPDQFGERRVTVRRQGQLPMEIILWKVQGMNQMEVPALKIYNDIPALTLLEQILGAGRMSRIYQQVVEKRISDNAWASSLLLRDAGVFMVGGVAKPGQSLAPIEKALLAEVDRIKQTPPSHEEMQRALRQIEASMIYARDSITSQAEQLGQFETVAGSWRYPDALLEKLRTVTPEDISRVAKSYLGEDTRTVGIFLPTGGVGGAAPAETGPAGYHSAVVDPLHAQAATAATGVAVANPVARKRYVLPNGLVLIVQENHANPTVAISASLKAGKAYDSAGKAGTADMVANLLDRGTTARSSNQIAEELEGVAASITCSTGWETAGVSGQALSGDTALLLRNMADELRNPIFPQQEIDKMREQMLSGLQMDRDQPDENARRAFYRAVLPAGHPYRLASFDEEAAGTAAITRDDLLAFHHAHYSPQGMIMAVVGDVKADDVYAQVQQYFGDWQGAPPTPLAFTPVTDAKAARVVTAIPDKSEVDIYVGYAAALSRSSDDFYAAKVMNLILGGGGALNSRLGDVIRDKNGLAYSLYSDFHASTGTGPWYTMLGVNPQNTDKAITLLQSEIARMRDGGVSEQEVQDAIAYITGAYAITLETNGALASALADAEYFHLGLDYPERATTYYAAVTRAQVNAAAKKYLHPDTLTVSIAGTYEEKK